MKCGRIEQRSEECGRRSEELRAMALHYRSDSWAEHINDNISHYAEPTILTQGRGQSRRYAGPLSSKFL